VSLNEDSLERKVAAPVEINGREGNRRAVHDTPLSTKSGTKIRRPAAVLGQYSSLAD
jgi:hypothetical protein